MSQCESQNVPGRRVTGAGLVVAPNRLCVVVAGIRFKDDLDIIDRFLGESNGQSLCSEKHFVDGMESGWDAVVSYKKGIIRCRIRRSGQRAGVIKVLLLCVKTRKHCKKDAAAELLVLMHAASLLETGQTSISPRVRSGCRQSRKGSSGMVKMTR